MTRVKNVFLTMAVGINLLYLIFSIIPVKPVKKTGIINPLVDIDSPNNNQQLASVSQDYNTSNFYKILGAQVEKPYNVLLLGLDGRKGDSRPRCDAVHIFTISAQEENVTITSIPRGTYVDIQGVDRPSSYLSNSCHLKGIDFAVTQIVKISGIVPDAIVKVGFSQTMGILRVLDMPTIPTLQYLRNRKYAIGDKQRSHNQALFIKDMISNHLANFLKLPRTVQYIAYRMLDTDLDFEKALDLAKLIRDKNIDTNPNKLILVTKPIESPYLKDLHFSELLDPTYTLTNDDEFQLYQDNLASYLANLISKAHGYLETSYTDRAYQLIQTPFQQELWLQIEDDDSRNNLHYDLLEIFVSSSPTNANLSSLILDFLTEIENTNQNELKNKAQNLLLTLIN